MDKKDKDRKELDYRLMKSYFQHTDRDKTGNGLVEKIKDYSHKIARKFSDYFLGIYYTENYGRKKDCNLMNDP